MFNFKKQCLKKYECIVESVLLVWGGLLTNGFRLHSTCHVHRVMRTSITLNHTSVEERHETKSLTAVKLQIVLEPGTGTFHNPKHHGIHRAFTPSAFAHIFPRTCTKCRTRNILRFRKRARYRDRHPTNTTNDSKAILRGAFYML